MTSGTRTVWKYSVMIDDPSTLIEMPAQAGIVHAAMPTKTSQAQHRAGGDPSKPWVDIWAEVDTIHETTEREFCIIGTGRPVPDDGHYLKTVVDYTLGLVWHLYEIRIALRPMSDLERTRHENMRRLVEDDKTETVYPRGIPKTVPRDKCRCPILDVGDFCPVHGG